MLIIKYIDLWGEAHQRILPEFDTLVEWLECGRATLKQQCGEDVDERLQKNFERFFDNGMRIKWWPEQLWQAPATLRHLWSSLFVASVSGEVIEHADATTLSPDRLPLR